MTFFARLRGNPCECLGFGNGRVKNRMKGIKLKKMASHKIVLSPKRSSIVPIKNGMVRVPIVSPFFLGEIIGFL